MPTIKEAVKAPSEADFKTALSLFASGVTIITTKDEAGRPHGMTATAFSSLSLDPPLVMIAITQGSRCHRHLQTTHRFGVSILHESQADLSRHFAGKPSAVPVFVTLDRVPILQDALVSLSCTLDASHAGGDHSIFVGRVTATRIDAGKPLLHFMGGYRKLAEEA